MQKSFDLKPNILMAIPYCDKNSLAYLSDKGKGINFFLDSGAFTAFKVGKKITVDDYCEFIGNLGFKPFGYFTLDVIGDPVGTLKNFDQIKGRGFDPIPIFTRGSNMTDLDEWFGKADVVGCGGGTGTAGYHLFIRDVSKAIENKSRKLHWLGFTDKNFIAKYRPFSCDSSTSNNAVKYNNVMIYQGNGDLKFLHRSKFRDDTSNMLAKTKHFFDWCEQDVFKLREDEAWTHGGTADLVTAIAFAHYSIDVELKFGTKIFTAVGNAKQLQQAHDVWHFCAKKLRLI